MSSLNIAMIGAGRMGRSHARVLTTLADVRVTHIYDQFQENAQRVAEALGAEAAPSLEAVLTDSSIQAVIITAPTQTHAELVTQAAKAGKAIFVEKPVAHDLKGAAEVVRVVSETGVPCQVGFQRRYDPALVEAKRRIDAGELGKLENFRGISRDPHAPTLDYLKTSGGIMVDFGIHDLDTMRFIMGEVEEVRAIGTVVRDPDLHDFGLFDLAVAILKFQSGALGSLECALNTSYGYEIVADILGEKGKLHVEKTHQHHMSFWGGHGVSHDYPANFDERFPEAYAAEVVAFATNVLAGNAVTPGPADATESLRLSLAAQHALETGQTVHVPSFTG